MAIRNDGLFLLNANIFINSYIDLYSYKVGNVINSQLINIFMFQAFCFACKTRDKSSNPDQLILSASKPDFFCVYKSGLPLGVWMVQVEILVVWILLSEGLDMLIQPASLQDGHLVAQVDACLIQSNRIEGSKHSNIRDNWNVIFCMTVAEW